MTRASRVTAHSQRTAPADTRRWPPERPQPVSSGATGTRSWTWQRDAACRDLGSSLFFAADGERGPARRRREAAAVAVCARCPVRLLCALHALATRQRYGVWGGLTEDDRWQAVAGQGRRA